MTLDAYAKSFSAFATALPQKERANREARFAVFMDRGFPTRREEDWRYTDLAPLNDRVYELASAALLSTAIESIPETDRLVYIDGCLDSKQSQASVLSAPSNTEANDSLAHDSLDHLNHAFAGDGLNLNLAANTLRPKALHVVLAGSASTQPVMNHQRHRIVLGEAAEATVILEFTGLADGDRFSTQVVEIELAPNARLNLYRVQRESAGTTLLTRIDAQLSRDSRLRVVCIDGGNGLARHDLNIAIDGPGAEAEVDGLYLAKSGAHIDNHARLVHEKPRGRSRAHFRGIVHERGRAVLAGKVVVKPNAQKTDSELRIANLLLARKAEVNAKPDLEIYADDVKCAHGLTVGQLDDVALEYLRSRGIGEIEARALLLRAFAAATLDRIAFAPLRRHVEEMMDFPRDSAIEALAALSGEVSDETLGEADSGAAA